MQRWLAVQTSGSQGPLLPVALLAPAEKVVEDDNDADDDEDDNDDDGDAFSHTDMQRPCP